MQGMPVLLQALRKFLHKSLLICIHAIAWSVLALGVLLFMQWPLREWVQAYSRQANDVAQIVFALLAAASIAAASMAGTHLSAHVATHTNANVATHINANVATHSGNAATQQPAWRKWALALCVLPWAVFMLWASAPLAWNALVSLEKFGETSTPGFFIIKCAVLLMAVLVLMQTLLQLQRDPPA